MHMKLQTAWQFIHSIVQLTGTVLYTY